MRIAAMEKSLVLDFSCVAPLLFLRPEQQLAFDQAQERKLRLDKENELQLLQATLQMNEDLINPLVMRERLANDKLVQCRHAAIAARDCGFPIPTRRVGVLDCSSRPAQLYDAIPLEGEVGLSSLQDLVLSDWHPVKVVDGEEVREACRFPFLLASVSRETVCCCGRSSIAMMRGCEEWRTSSQRRAWRRLSSRCGKSCSASMLPAGTLLRSRGTLRRIES